MRAIDCDCGHHLEAADDEALVAQVRSHAAEAHPEMGLTDEQVRQLIAETAYDA